jgi:acyl transferase domain-containing protein
MEFMSTDRDESASDIAIIGMGGRFPGAAGLEEFWNNLCEGREGIRVISDAELLQHGVDPQVLSAGDYVKAVADVPGIEFFDNGFFGFTPRDAEIMDPQLR